MSNMTHNSSNTPLKFIDINVILKDWGVSKIPFGKTPIPDIDVIETASLDEGTFDKPWIVQFHNGRIVEFDSEDDACHYQKSYRLHTNRDPLTGEPNDSCYFEGTIADSLKQWNEKGRPAFWFIKVEGEFLLAEEVEKLVS